MTEILEIDAGEKKIINILTKRKIDFTTTGNSIQIGDIRRGDTVIERKEINDFFNSMGIHLQNQYMDLQSYPQKWIIISGYLETLNKRNYNKIPQFYGMLARLARQGICVVHVKDDEMLVTVALGIFEKVKKLPSDFRLVKRKKNDVYEIVHASASRIKKNDIEALLNEFGSPLEIGLASQKELIKVKGIGPKIAKRIYKNFRNIK